MVGRDFSGKDGKKEVAGPAVLKIKGLKASNDRAV